MNKTKVLLMSRELGHGGSERQLAETALGLDRDRFEPHVGAFHIDGFRAEELRRSGVPVIQFPVHSFKSPAALRGAAQLVKYVQNNDIKLVHAFDVPLDVFAVPVTRLFTRAIALSSQRAHRHLVRERSQRLMLNVSDRLAHGIVVNCQFIKRYLVGDVGIPENRIRVCYNGVDLDRFRRPAGARSSAGLVGLPPGVTVIGTMCALRPEKGLSFLLEGFAGMKGRAAAKLLIVGDGPEKVKLLDQARSLGIEADCIFQPGAAAVEQWLWAMDVFVLPSLSEAFSNSIMEAMAAGCAVAATPVGGTPELIVHGERGWLFAPRDAPAVADALTKLVQDAPLRDRLARAGHRFIQQFSRHSSAERMGQIYREYLPI
ncbi:MAG TPA: glycosyltransferase family 4 protein [Bryobacteraceae bacterium]|nr:glycosyltransferase family 4 protein [Bryobacteraceae bacterium]